MKVRVVDETKKVRKAIKAGSKRALERAGAMIRGDARRSLSDGIAKRGKNKGQFVPSKPGKPPRSPTGRLKGSIFFAVDRLKTSVVIGPARSGAGRVGNTHEFSGSEKPKGSRRPANWKLQLNAARKFRGGHGPVRDGAPDPVGYARLATPAMVRRAREIAASRGWSKGELQFGPRRARQYPARPFMGPALARQRDRLPSLWRNAIKR